MTRWRRDTAELSYRPWRNIRGNRERERERDFFFLLLSCIFIHLEMILFSVDRNGTDVCACEITLMPTEFVEHRCFHATHVHWQKRRSQHEIYGFREENMRPFIRREWQWTNEITSTCFYPANRLRLPSVSSRRKISRDNVLSYAIWTIT